MSYRQKFLASAALAGCLIFPQIGHAEPTSCDTLAASPVDASRPAGVPGVAFDAIDVGKAVPACITARRANPADARVALQLARTLHRQGGHDAQALKLYREAARRGSAAALYSLAVLHSRGMIVTANVAEAVRLYREASAAGVAAATRNLGAMYEAGRGVAQSDTEATRLYRAAAEADDPDAMQLFGVSLANGIGTTKDEATAANWFRRAADRGSAAAMTNLGIMYSEGRGVGKDLAQAIAWYRKAAEAGDIDAMRFLVDELQIKTDLAKNEAPIPG